MPIGTIILGIKTKYTGSALETALGTNKMYATQAPEGTAHPYCVVSVIDSIDVGTFTEDMEYIRVQFSIITNELNKAKATTGLNALEIALRGVFDDQVLTVSGWTNTGMAWKGSSPIFSYNTKVIGVSIEYETYIFKSK